MLALVALAFLIYCLSVNPWLFLGVLFIYCFAMRVYIWKLEFEGHKFNYIHERGNHHV